MERETMPPTAFAEVRRGLDLGREADEAIDRLLAIKENAREKERTVPETALCNQARLLDDITAIDFPTSNEVCEIWNYSKYGD